MGQMLSVSHKQFVMILSMIPVSIHENVINFLQNWEKNAPTKINEQIDFCSEK